MTQSLKVIAACLLIYAVYLPVAIFVHRDYVQLPRPTGKAVEMILKFDVDKPDRYITRSYVFSPKSFPDTSKVRVYEDMTPLPVSNVWFTQDGAAYVIRIRASDGSDARTNGRQYWLVAPMD